MVHGELSGFVYMRGWWRGCTVRAMPTYFGGNILPPESQRTSSDHTFRFNREEAQKLQLVGKDVRLEHDAALTVGKVVKQMKDRRGRVYVIGRIDAEDKKTKHRAMRVFADKALGGLYNSLSLQHVHEEDMDGSNAKKTAVEVSLVNVPRRAQCDIHGIRRTRTSVSHAASGKKTQASKKCDYIPEPQGTNAHRVSVPSTVNMSTAPTDASAAQSTAAESAEPVSAAAPAAAPAAAAAPVKDEDVAMQDVVQALVAQVSLCSPPAWFAATPSAPPQSTSPSRSAYAHQHHHTTHRTKQPTHRLCLAGERS